MIRLQDRLPDHVFVRGHRIRLNLDFRNVLKMLDILDDDTLMPDAKTYLAVRCLTRRVRYPEETLEAVKQLLFHPGKAEDASRPKIMDYDQDAAMIRTAFRQEYGIDLFRDKLHYLEFVELLHELPEGNRLMDVIGIRARPMPEPTKYNAKEREWLLKAKAAHALHMSEKEQEKFYDQAVKNVFSGLMRMAEGGELHE